MDDIKKTTEPKTDAESTTVDFAKTTANLDPGFATGITNRKTMNKNMATDFAELIRQEAISAGMEITDDVKGLSAYILDRADILSQAIGEPGYSMAVTAERNNIAMFAANHAVMNARHVDRRVLAVIRGGIGIVARAMLVN